MVPILRRVRVAVERRRHLLMSHHGRHVVDREAGRDEPTLDKNVKTRKTHTVEQVVR
jgi:hypothetical protein